MHITPDLPLKVIQEISGSRLDLALLKNEKWLINTEVCYWIQERKSQWHLNMLYISIDDPLKFICRKIDTYNSEKKAITFAEILQRGIRKDTRGILKTNRNAFNFCDN